MAAWFLRKHTSLVCGALMSVMLLSGAASARGADETAPTRDAKQAVDEAYSAKIKKYTTDPSFTSPLVEYLPASKTVPTPEVVLGDVAGAPGILPYAEDVYKYMRMLEKTSPRVKVYSIGMTEEGREMIAVAVSADNRCFYCLTAHGAAVRQISGIPQLGELMAMNWRAAGLPQRQYAMLAFAEKITFSSAQIEEADRQALREVGFSEREIWDIAAVAAFFNMSNRLASAVDMRPNDEYHARAR